MILVASDNEISRNQTDGQVMFISTTDCAGEDSYMSNGSFHIDNHSGSTTEIDEEHNVDFKSKFTHCCMHGGLLIFNL